MEHFPKIRTEALERLTVVRTLVAPTQVLRFIDGAEQRYAQAGRIRWQWRLTLDFLDEAEVATLTDFLLRTQGHEFVFTDPADQSEHVGCVVTASDIQTLALGESRYQIIVDIKENYSGETSLSSSL